MLTTVSNLPPRAKVVQARTASMRLLRPTTSALVRHRQQTREFRLGWAWWSWHCDTQHHRETRRRHRVLRYKYADSLNRKLSWEQHPQANEAKRAFKRMVGHYWDEKNGRPCGKYVNVDSSNTPENPQGVRPGRNIEDVERGAMDHLLFGENGVMQGSQYEYDFYTTPMQNLRKYVRHHQDQMTDALFGTSAASSKPVHSTTPPSATAGSEVKVGAEEDYVIDPITNRKVPKKLRKPSPKENVKIPVRSFKAYRSQFAPFKAPKAENTQAPIFYDGPPPRSELKQYEQMKIDDPQVEREQTLEGQPAPSAEEMRKYSEADIDEDPSDTTVRQNSRSAPSPFWTPRTKQSPVMQSDAQVQGHKSKASKPLNKDTNGGFVAWGYRGVFRQAGEDAMPRDDPAIEAANRRPNFFPWEKVPNQPKPDELNMGTPVIHGDFAQDMAASQEYNDLHKYKPVMEPEPKDREESTPPYADLDKYNAFRYNEPDGKPPSYVEKETYDDLHKYKPFSYDEPDGKSPGLEEQGYDPKELEKYEAVRWNEPDGKPQAAEELVNPAELDKYTPVKHNEPDGKPTTAPNQVVDPKETSQYGAVRYNEFDGKLSAQNVVDSDLSQYDLSAHDKWMSSHRAALEESDESHEGILKKLQKFSSSLTADPRAEDVNPPHSRYTQASVDKSHYRSLLESLMNRIRTTSDAADQEAAASVSSKKTQARQQQEESTPEVSLTGTYARDFPEEFAKSWTTSEGTPASILQPADSSSTPAAAQARIQNEEREYAENVSIATSFSKLEPSLDRQKQPAKSMSPEEREKVLKDPYSTEPQGLETSFAEECGDKPTWPAYVKIHSQTKIDESPTPDRQGAAAVPQNVETSAMETSEPTVYKILAYDPTMQTINSAETTSIVPDTASGLTPAEVLLRLSNPSKFFPHFAPLQAQGFEIVSGSGDVLVFRKVRDASAEEEASPSPAFMESKPKPESTTPPPAVNPIDMTGTTRYLSPASANFASPTGYVNYDLPRFEDASEPLPPPPPRFKSNIDVRREEPVFSGPKTVQQSSGKTGKSVPRRMLTGAAWVAGISYALGVVGEYFKTGGADGKGPTGL